MCVAATHHDHAGCTPHTAHGGPTCAAELCKQPTTALPYPRRYNRTHARRWAHRFQRVATGADRVWLGVQVSAAAGLTLLPLALWLTVANALVWGTWRLNGRPPLLPQKAAAT